MSDLRPRPDEHQTTWPRVLIVLAVLAVLALAVGLAYLGM